MNIETRKVSIISWITHLSDEEKSEIEHGLSEIEQGETKTHDEVMSKYKKWL